MSSPLRLGHIGLSFHAASAAVVQDPAWGFQALELAIRCYIKATNADPHPRV